MKNFNKALVVLALFLLVFPGALFAAEFRAGEQSSFTSQEKTEGNLYMAGGTVISAGSIEKDLLVAGGTALISGPVAGDLFAVGGNVTVSSQILGDVRIGGGTIIITGDIAGDAVIGGGQITLSGKSVGGDVAIAGGTVRVDSEVKGKAKIAGGKIYINAPIDGNVDIKAENLTLGPNANIKGNLKYEATKPVTIEEGGKVSGETSFTEIKRNKGGRKDTNGVFGFFDFALLTKFVTLLVSSLVIGLIFTKYSKELVEKATANPLKELGRGIVTLIVLPILSIILLVTIIGIPFGIIGLLSFIILFVFASILTPLFLGSLVYRWISKSEYIVNWKTILLGVVIYMLLGLIPFMGWIIICVSAAITLGAMLNIKWQVAKEWK
ncbi:MAG: hypothetical protein LiPW41_790 [Parcubacteria group bacterium LiPW_41]|nr:MAG: hypothetical protein LiPW41_790 [Parcubacteria group bacterium LiPW_41]